MRTAEAAALTGAYDRAIALVHAALDDDSAARAGRRAHRRLARASRRSITSGRAIPDAAQPVALSCARASAGRPSFGCASPGAGHPGPGARAAVPLRRVRPLRRRKRSQPRGMVGSAEAEIRALGCIGRNAAAVGDADSGVRTLRQALTLARSVGDFSGAAEISIELALALHWAGRPGRGLPGRR